MSDVYCLFCGCPTTQREVFDNRVLDKTIGNNPDILNNHPDIQACYEILSEKHEEYDGDIFESINYNPEHDWMTNLTLLAENGEIVHPVYHRENMFVYGPNDECYSNSGNTELVDNWGFIVHTDCLECVKQEYPDFSVGDIVLDEKYVYISDDINYGELEEFQHQYCSFHALYYHNPNLMKSPLICISNRERILNDILSQITKK